MSNVHRFGNTVLPGEAHADLVETLEGLLEQAKAGELRAMAYCTVRTGNVIGTGWDGADGTRHPMSGAIMILHSRYALALQDED